MKKPLPRELLWMTLPVVLLGGTAWWLSSGGQMSAHLPALNVKGMIVNARRPSMWLFKTEARWCSPTQRALEGRNFACSVSAFVEASASWQQARPANFPQFKTIDVVDDMGHSLLAHPAKTGTVSRSDFWPRASRPANSRAKSETTYTLSADVPWKVLPPSTCQATFVSSVGWGTARPLPIKFEIVPAWMRRSATYLHVERVTWDRYPQNTGSNVEVICRITKPRKPSVYGFNEATKWEQLGHEGIAIGYDSQKGPGSARNDVILGEWSQRVESGDGKLNSLDLLSTHAKKALARLNQRQHGYAPGELTDGFSPYCILYRASVQKDRIHLTYNINTIPKTFKNPVFRCEIYLVGDGLVRVRLPLTKPIKESR